MHKTVRGERIPYGASYRAKHHADGELHFYHWRLFLKIPLFVWYRSAYDISRDGFYTGWHTFSVLLEINRVLSGVSAAIHWGWVPHG